MNDILFIILKVIIQIILCFIFYILISKKEKNRNFNDGYEKAITDITHHGYYLDNNKTKHYINIEEYKIDSV